MPAVTPVTTPVNEPTLTAPAPTLHIPPPAPSLSVVVCPAHTCIVPVIAVGAVFTVTVFVAIQPAGEVFVITAVPVSTPVTIPVVTPTVATVVIPLIHVLPLIELLHVLVDPVQIPNAPVITGTAFTVIVLAAVQLPME